jgi:hypothetical protein
MRAEQRRQLIAQHIALIGYVPTTRAMAKWLYQHGCPISHVSVAADYQILGIKAGDTPSHNAFR